LRGGRERKLQNMKSKFEVNNSLKLSRRSNFIVNQLNHSRNNLPQSVSHNPRDQNRVMSMSSNGMSSSNILSESQKPWTVERVNQMQTRPQGSLQMSRDTLTTSKEKSKCNSFV